MYYRDLLLFLKLFTSDNQRKADVKEEDGPPKTSALKPENMAEVCRKHYVINIQPFYRLSDHFI